MPHFRAILDAAIRANVRVEMSDEEFKPTELDAALSGDEAVQDAAPQQSPEPIAEPSADAPAEQVQAEQTAPQTPQDAPTEPQEPSPEKGWTYAAYSDEKSKRQALEKEVAEMKARQSAWDYEQKRLAAQKPAALPDQFEDPEGYSKAIQQNTLAQVMPVIDGLREQVAKQVHGAEALETANSWFSALPQNEKAAIWTKANQSQDPYGVLVMEHKRQSILADLGDDPDAYKQKIIAEYIASQGGAIPQPQPQQTARQVKIMPSATSVANVGSRNGPVWGGALPLDEILPE